MQNPKLPRSQISRARAKSDQTESDFRFRFLFFYVQFTRKPVPTFRIVLSQPVHEALGYIGAPYYFGLFGNDQLHADLQIIGALQQSAIGLEDFWIEKGVAIEAVGKRT